MKLANGRVRRPELSLMVIAVIVALTAACGGSHATAGSLQSPVNGLLKSVEAGPDGSIASITLATDAGDDLRFRVELADPASVDAQHLQQHADERWPVSVAFAGAGDRRVVYRIDDVP